MDKEKFQSRKYRFILFWNIMAASSIILQFILSYTNHETKIPVEIIAGIAGVLNGEYLGVNILEKKILKENPLETVTGQKK